VGQMRGRPVFRNIQLSGKPEVLSEVKLISGNYLEGWFTPGQLANLPKRLRDKDPERPDTFDEWGNLIPQNEKKEEVYDWQVKNGELLGRKLDRDRDRPIPSSLQYFRRLHSGETVRYEFYFEPGKTHVHPALGNLAFLLEPEGTKLHWMADLSMEDWSGLPADNAIDDPKGRRGDKLPLKAGAWNSAALTVTTTGVKLVLNEITVYEADLEPSVERVFGFFHYRARSGVRVRNVVLTGAWAKSLPSLEEVAMKGVTHPEPATAKVRRSLLGENYYAVEASEVLERARKLPAKERYEALSSWVLPNELRPVFQLGGTTKPQDVLGVVDQKAQPAGKRVSLGGRLDLPALELMASAKEASMLAELFTRIEKLGSKGDDDSFNSSKLALSASVLASLGREEEAAQALRSLLPIVEKMPLDAPAHQRWPIVVAIYGTAEVRALHKVAGELAEAENKKLDEAAKKEIVFADSDNWRRNFQTARGRLLMATGSETKLGQAEGDGTFTYWASTPSFDSSSRSQGFGVPHWRIKDGALAHYPGSGQDYLALRIPLRGDFEASCALRLEAGREADLVYGLHAFSLNPEAKKYRLHSGLDRTGHETTIAPPLPANKRGSYQLKAVMKDGWFRAHVDGREIATEKIGVNCDPWLMIYVNHLDMGEIRDLRIQGQPKVPSSLDLLSETDLGNWRSYGGVVQRNQNYGGWADNSYPLDQPYYGQAWTKRGEEIFQPGRKPDDPPPGRPMPPRANPESALFYHRPMLEDGAIEYEFFYVPEKTQVHPMLDRLTFLLDPEGIKLHWLTDGVSEKSKIAFDNVLVEPSCRRGPSQLALEPKAWNKVRLAIAGDVVKIALNGVEVYERPIEPTNQRTFGLFHYTDRTEARVRRMNYLGAWPKKLPADAELFELKK
ncbi:MAG TPA: DUF1583 domain-containing protein, partial [Gemmataceae bacterium]|nr:DUF1583 domain-containing protein [Gemmataceae bacterium]